MLSENRVYPTAKFDQPCNLSIVFSMVTASVVFLLMVLFMISSLDWSVEVVTYSDLLIDKIGNVSYVLAVLPEHGKSPLRDYVGLNIDTDSDSLFFTMECMMLCHWANAPSKVIRGYLPNVSSGLHTVFTTSLFSHRSILLQIYLHEITPKQSEWSVEVITVRNTERFGTVVFRVRSVMSVISLMLAVAYAVVMRVSMNPVRLEHGLAFVSIVLCAFGCVPINAMFQHVGTFVYEQVLSGLLTSVNILALCAFVHKSETDSIHSVLPFAAFFAGVVVMSNLTDDTQILARMFDNSMVVWAFFRSATVVFAFACALIVLRGLVAHKCRARNTKKPMFYGYMLSFFLVFFPITIEGLTYAFSGYKSVAVDFFARYLTQCLLACLYVDMHWPLVAKETMAVALGMDDEVALGKPVDDELDIGKIPEVEMFLDT